VGIFGLRGRAVHKMRDLVGEHLRWVEETLNAMAEAVEAFLAGTPWEALEERAVEVHRRESRADDARRDAETALVRGALLVGTRRNLLTVLDVLDLVANHAEGAVDFLVYQRVAVPAVLHPLIREFLKGLSEEWEALRAAVAAFLSANAPETVRLADEVDQRESRLDDVHRRLILRLFATDLPLAEKIQARDFVNHLEACANAMEDVADLLTVAVAASLSF
jgi:predicted phosphate transport protein (TIGR00153 family)